MRAIDADSFKLSINTNKFAGFLMEQIIDMQPTVDKKAQWIPVAERLPDYDPDPGEYFPMLIIFTKRDGVTPGFYNECTKKWFACELRTCVFAETAEEDVIAWMPMPEPYEPDGTKMKADWQ